MTLHEHSSGAAGSGRPLRRSLFSPLARDRQGPALEPGSGRSSGRGAGLVSTKPRFPAGKPVCMNWACCKKAPPKRGRSNQDNLFRRRPARTPARTPTPMTPNTAMVKTIQMLTTRTPQELVRSLRAARLRQPFSPWGCSRKSSASLLPAVIRWTEQRQEWNET